MDKVDLQATIAFEQALRFDEHSDTLFARATVYQNYGWHDAAKGTFYAAERLRKVEAGMAR